MNEYFNCFLYLKSPSTTVTDVGRSLEIIVMRGNCIYAIKVIIQGVLASLIRYHSKILY